MRKRNRFGLALRLSGVLFAVLSAAGGIQAAQLVTFTGGQSIVVQSAEKRGAWYYFILEGGGELGVPVSRVASIEEYEPPPVSVVAAAAPTIPAVAAVSPAQQPAGQPMVPGNPAQPVAGGQQAEPGSTPPATQPNVAAQGEDDWRYKVRMSGGPKREAPNLYGPGTAGARGPLSGRKVPPGAQRRYPPPSQQQNPQN
jgi:hypothetical protein